ncbi:MAG TPA: alpha-glucosidase [Candidatus Limnocylindrales bacterium]|nr:alpha-glucosidase [Candidatus Limnocylindrales bacterium]
MRQRFHSLVVLLLSFFVVLPFVSAQSKPVDAEGHQWWQHAVFQEIYPRSYMDSNNDGIGDLNGIASKMEYLKWLGVDAIWIAPCFPSPQVDFGYDVSDYENIDPMYGTLADFDKMEKIGKTNGVGIVFDFVVNHTSDKHKWFIESSSSKTNPYHDWYIWKDPKGTNQPPNNWTSTFGGSAWQWNPKLNQFYYHYFYPQQPDLNWRNPKVANAMYDSTRFWYKRGVVGFRLDAVDTLFEDPNLTDNPALPGKDEYGDQNQERKYNDKQPEVHEVMKGLRKAADQYNAVLIGETWTSDVSELKDYYGTKHDELQMPMDLMFTELKPLSADVFRKHVGAVDASGEWPVYVMSNHDIKRAYSRFADGKHDDDIAKVMAGMYLTLRGSAIMYYGEEIGMANNDPTRKEDVKDPIGQLGWPEQKGRDGERTPMQWNTAPNAGFTTGIPWLPVPMTYETHNVESEKKDPNSILNFYKKLLALRHSNPALLDGDYVALNQDDANVYSYLRRYKGQAVLVVLNMSETPKNVSFDLSKQGFSNGEARTLLSTINGGAAQKLSRISLPPYTVYIGEVTK